MDVLEKTKAEKYLSASSLKNVTDWIEGPKYSEYRAELVQMLEEGRWDELEDAFFKVVEFGTGGRRGTTGLGSNRINHVTMGESAQALCQYAESFDPKAPQKGVVIACDTRLSSPELSRFVASVCVANGFTTYFFESFRSTPELSFSVRELGCAVGIVISASHNQPADNGFKAYWDDGAQLVAPHDKGVLAVGAKIEEIHTYDFDKAVSDGKILIIGKDIDEKYISAAVSQAEGTARDLRIVYSPLHGAGQRNTLPVLQKAGFHDVRVVEEQMIPDGNFPTIEDGRANPEKKVANDRAVAQMLAEDADIAITNDPDADRLGIMVRQDDEVVYLSGNQSAALATEYSLRKKSEKGELTNKHFIAKTIVTTEMMRAVAEKYGAICYGNLQVGFKFIGEVIRKREPLGEIFVVGAEESFGFLKGSYARDKDGASSLALAEYAAELKLEGKTLWDRLKELYHEYGFYWEHLETIVCPGAKGFGEMQAIMAKVRQDPPKEIDGHEVTAMLDYATLIRLDTKTGAKTPIDCLSGNVVVLEFDGLPERRFTVRPSGTEPIIKFYIQWLEDASDDIDEQCHELDKQLEGMARKLEGLLKED